MTTNDLSYFINVSRDYEDVILKILKSKKTRMSVFALQCHSYLNMVMLQQVCFDLQRQCLISMTKEGIKFVRDRPSPKLTKVLQ